MREIYVADSETDPFKHNRVPMPFLWGAYNGDEFTLFDKTDDFVNFMREKPVIVYAHNGGKFDWFYILEHLEPFTPLTVINGRLSKFKIGECEFRDSWNIIPIALAKYQKTKIDYHIFEALHRGKPANRRKIESYLFDDCRYQYDLVTAYIEQMGLNLTLAGGAFKQWRKLSKVAAPKGNRGFHTLLANFYYGGRVECFHGGMIKKPFKVADINSAYPYAMTHRHPWGNKCNLSVALPESRQDTEQAFITVRADATGVFPYKCGAGLTFPADGEPRTFQVTGWEYLAAEETGYLQNAEVESVLTLPESIDFTEYVAHWFEKKKIAKESKDKAGYWIAKLHLNALYGKFGSNPDNYKEYINIHPSLIVAAGECDGWDYCASIKSWAIMCRDLPEEKKRWYNIGVAASVTGFVRAYLWRALCQCNGLLYCDTDCIAAHSVKRLDMGDKLGEWSIEADCDRGAIAGKKMYAFHQHNGKWKTATKGVKLTPAAICQIARGGTVTYHSESPTYSLKRGVSFVTRTVAKTV